MDPFSAQHELLELFECEPSVADTGVPWAYNALRFDTTRGADRIVCEIEPGYEELRLYLSRDGVELIHLELHWATGLEVQLGSGVEVLVVTFRDSHLFPMRLQLKPTINLRWGTAIDPFPSRVAG